MPPHKKDWFCEPCGHRVMSKHVHEDVTEPEKNSTDMIIKWGVRIPDVLIIGDGEHSGSLLPKRVHFFGMFYGGPDI